MLMTLSRTLTRHWRAYDMLTIGLVNNMPPAALRSTERQFSDILTLAAQDTKIDLKLFRMSGVKPGNYGDLDNLLASDLDGLIVTGAEPRATSLQEEPSWQPLTQIIQWSSKHTSSVIWSCLAAHTAVFYLDGIERRAHQEKIFGVFDSVKTAEHLLLANAESVWRVPHSRWNDLHEDDLAARGYTVLAKSNEAGVDLFIKQCQLSLFVFIQTHPEYDVDSLMREYSRDIALFYSGKREVYPKIPTNYFDAQIADKLEELRNDAIQNRDSERLDLLNQVYLPNSWRPTAVQLYRNWLTYLIARKSGMIQVAL